MNDFNLKKSPTNMHISSTMWINGQSGLQAIQKWSICQKYMNYH